MSSTTGSAPSLPNVVIVLADDLGFYDLGCYRELDGELGPGRVGTEYGSELRGFTTPHIDRLAGRGMRFTDAHAASAVCTPSRYALLTGEYCWRTRLQQGVLWPYERALIEPGTPTVASMLGAHGYQSAAIGKWHLGWEWAFRTPPPAGRDAPSVEVDVDYSTPIGGGPLDHGFDEFFGLDAPNFPPYCFIEGRSTVGTPDRRSPEGMFGEPGDMVEGWDQTAVAGTLTDRAVEFIERRRDSPFLLYFAHPAPHTPIVPNREWLGRSGIGPYGDFVMQFDADVGRVIDALERTGQIDNTILIVTSDNGSPARFDQWQPPSSLTERTGYSPSGPLRGMKGDCWEGGHRVPLIVSWPERVIAGSVNDRLVSLIDVMATLADIVGVDITCPAARSALGQDSISILGYLDGSAAGEPLRPWLVHHGFDGAYGVRRDRWKLICDRGSGGFSPSPYAEFSIFDARLQQAPPYQLYDLVADLGETDNRYADRPEVVGELAALLSAVRFRLPPLRLDDAHRRWETIA